MSQKHNLPETDEQSTEAEIAKTTSGVVSGATGEFEPDELDIDNEASPMVQYTGETGFQKIQHDQDMIAEMLAKDMYDEESVAFRELTQNAESACIEFGKQQLRYHPEYGEEWLYHTYWVDSETGETITKVGDRDGQSVLAEHGVAENNARRISLPRNLEEVVAEARSIGYDPTIEITLKRDDRVVEIEDNGIGMTAETFHEAYNYNGRGESKRSSETGGKWGIGSRSFGILTGMESKMTVTTRTRKPDAPEQDYAGIQNYVSVMGYKPLDKPDISDEFRGTRLEIPILPLDEGGPSLDEIQDHVEKYTQTVRVPVLYREVRDGEVLIEEEYGGVSLVEKFEEETGHEPPVVVDRPGEFTAVAGPDIKVGSQGYSSPDRPDTWLVSMPIDRNTNTSVKSFWKVAIQIHNEQGLCIAGPHRGQLKHTVDEIHEDDVFTPQPTTDRDRLNKGDVNDDFFAYVSDQIKERELEEVGEIVDAMFNAEHPADAILEREQDWTLFYKMVRYHGNKNSKRRFLDFVDENDVFPDLHLSGSPEGPQTKEEKTARKIYRLFEEVSHAPEHVRNGSRKKGRENAKLGEILSKVPADQVFMAASTGGNFEYQRKVLAKTYEDWDVIVLSNASQYARYENTFDFKKLKEVPVTQDNEHDYDVPDHIHEEKKRTSSSQNATKPDEIEKRTLKFRTSSRNSSIDYRLTIEEVIERIESGRTLGDHDKIVLFPNGKDYENISDHYDFARYAAIASVNQTEYEVLADYDRVMTLEEYQEWSRSTIIATEEGGMTIPQIYADDRLVLLVYAKYPEHKMLISDEEETMREYYKQDVREQRTNMDDDDEIVMAVADKKTLKQAEWALNDGYRTIDEARGSIRGLYWSYNGFPINNIFYASQLERSKSTYETWAETPNWRDGDEIYSEKNKAKGIYEAVLDGFHEAGIDPTLLTLEEVEEAVAEIEIDSFEGFEPTDDQDEDTDHIFA